MATLGGVCWAYNALSMDYCLTEAVNSLKALCDEVVILDAGSTDSTHKLIKSLEDEKTTVVLCDNKEWIIRNGREKLSYFQNLAMSFLGTDYYIVAQADEVVHENSFQTIRRAIQTGAEGFFVSRINLWGSSQTRLEVPHERSPVGTKICRIAKVGYESVDDAESIFCPLANYDYVNDIRLYHMGFVRSKHMHVQKIKHMQEEVFQIDSDKKLEGLTEFKPELWFSGNDLVPISEPLPSFVQKWAKERDEINAK